MGPKAVIVATGEQHLLQRKLQRPALHGERIERLAGRIESLALAELEQLPTGRTVAVREAMKRITFEVLARAVIGLDDRDRILELHKRTNRMQMERLSPLLWVRQVRRRWTPWALFLHYRARVWKMLGEEIERARNDPRREDRDDVLALLIAAAEDGAPIDDETIRDDLMTLMLAGSESTATGLSWAVERLSRHPRVLARLREEVDGGGHEYTDAVIRETLRCRPPVMIAVRRAIEATELGGCAVPEGALVGVLLQVAHRDGDVWDDPYAFRPERFLEGKPKPYSYAPFGGGLRRCTGAAFTMLEMRIVLEALVRRWTILPVGTKDEGPRVLGVTMIPTHGGRVRLERRRDSTAGPTRERAVATAGTAEGGSRAGTLTRP
jgi:cytochrome P450